MIGLGLALGLPGAWAHGAPEGRDIDFRVLEDWTGPAAGTEMGPHVGEYNGMHTGAPFGPAHDILAVDVRELVDPSGEPALSVRYTFQGGNPAEGGELNDTLNFTIGEKTFGFYVATLDNELWTSDFPLIAGPFPVGDGFPLALEGIVPLRLLDAKIGDVVSAMKVVSSYHDASMNGMRMDGDVAPGGFNYNHFAVPAPTDDSLQLDYTLKGPPELFTVDLAADALEVPRRGETITVNLTVAPNGTALEQFINITIVPAPGYETNATVFSIRLAAEPRLVPVLLTAIGDSAPRPGTVDILATSDLGSLVKRTVAVSCGPDPAGEGNVDENAVGTDGSPAGTALADSNEGTAQETESASVPALPWLAPVLMLVAAVWFLGKRRE